MGVGTVHAVHAEEQAFEVDHAHDAGYATDRTETHDDTDGDFGPAVEVAFEQDADGY